jgi:hypothetical protein
MNGPIKTINLGALGQARDQAPLPKPDGALYRHPDPDGSRKACRNCVLFVSDEDRCVIHHRDQEIDAAQLCGYHVFGTPMKTWMELPGIQPVTPDISGLRWVGPGAACASCRFYRRRDDQGGLCIGVSDPQTRQPGVPVESRGWCARYEGM